MWKSVQPRAQTLRQNTRSHRHCERRNNIIVRAEQQNGSSEQVIDDSTNGNSVSESSNESSKQSSFLNRKSQEVSLTVQQESTAVTSSRGLKGDGGQVLLIDVQSDEPGQKELEGMKWKEVGDKLYFLEPDEAGESIDIAMELARRGRFIQAIEMYEFALTKPGEGLVEFQGKPKALSSEQKVHVNYDLACCFSIIGEVDKALVCFKEALDNGFQDWEYIYADNDIERMRKEERFSKLIDNYKLGGIAGFLDDNALYGQKFKKGAQETWFK